MVYYGSFGENIIPMGTSANVTKIAEIVVALENGNYGLSADILKTCFFNFDVT